MSHFQSSFHGAQETPAIIALVAYLNPTNFGFLRLYPIKEPEKVGFLGPHPI